MKVKFKFDMDKVKEFGKEHGEKFGLALAMLIFVVSVVKAVSRDHLPDKLQPDKINALSAKATEKINASHVPPEAQDVHSDNFLDRVDKQSAQVPANLIIPEFIKPTFPDPVKRIDPTLMAIEELHATPFRGALVAQPRERDRLGPAAAPAPAAGGLVPGRAAPAPRAGLAGRPAGAGRPAVTTPAGGLAGGSQNAATSLPFPADFHVPGPPSTGSADGCYGIVITGLIPVGAQGEEYARRFKNARRGVMADGPNGVERGAGHSESEADSPQYLWIFLERTDTTGGKPIVLNFGDIGQIGHDYKTIEKAKEMVHQFGINPAIQNNLEASEKMWGASGGEVVDRDFLMDKWVSWHLPPILLRNWGAEAAHPPQIPLAVPVAIAAPAGRVVPGVTPLDVFDAPASGGPPRRHEPRGMRGGIGNPNPRGQTIVEVPYKLFRFVDLNVEPGHAYQYRVRMMLRNPNFGLEPQVLFKPETAFVPYRQTPWSEMSPVAVIPPNVRLLGGGIEPPKRGERTDPKAKIDVFAFDPVQAIELIKEFDTELGALVSTIVAPTPVPPDRILKNVADPVNREIHDITGDFHTGAVLLDFRGNDEKLPGTEHKEGLGPTVSMTDPAEMLLLEDVDHLDNPRLIVLNEAKDKPIIDEWKKTHIAPAAPAAGASPLLPAKPKTGPANLGNGLLPPRGGQTRRPAGH